MKKFNGHLIIGVAAFVSVILLAPSIWARKITHTVVTGESLNKIAKLYDTTVEAICNQNNLTDDDQLREGRELVIETKTNRGSRSKTKHTISSGDTLSKIAKKYKMSVAQLRRMNPTLEEESLQIGKSIWIVTEAGSSSDKSDRTEKVAGRSKKKSGRGFYQLTSGPGYIVRDSRKAWGTFSLVNGIMVAMSAYNRRYPDASPIYVDDLSIKNGGKLLPHLSHRKGVDVDIRYPLVEPTEEYGDIRLSNMDLRRTWYLFKQFLNSDEVEYIFVDYKFQKALYEFAKDRGASQDELNEIFQYPHGKNTQTGIIRHEEGHKSHFHLRFKREAPKQVPVT